jgi:transposase-like protein
VARLLEVEVSVHSIHAWRRQEQIDHGKSPGLSPVEGEELKAARARIRQLEAELAVHRRASELLKESVRPHGGSRRSR